MHLDHWMGQNAGACRILSAKLIEKAKTLHSGSSACRRFVCVGGVLCMFAGRSRCFCPGNWNRVAQRTGSCVVGVGRNRLRVCREPRSNAVLSLTAGDGMINRRGARVKWIGCFEVAFDAMSPGANAKDPLLRVPRLDKGGHIPILPTARGTGWQLFTCDAR